MRSSSGWCGTPRNRSSKCRISPRRASTAHRPHCANRSDATRCTSWRRSARIIRGTAETEIAEKCGQAALTYQHNPVALHLRAMNMLYEAIKEKGAMVVVPSSAVETMGLGGMLGTVSMGGGKPQ